MKNLLNTFGSFFKRSFTKTNIKKALAIFLFGFILRYMINEYYNVNVFIEYLSPISIAFYSLFATFIVFINELFIHINPSVNYIQNIKSPSMKLKDGLIIDKTHGDIRIYDATKNHITDRSNGDIRIYNTQQLLDNQNYASRGIAYSNWQAPSVSNMYDQSQYYISPPGTSPNIGTNTQNNRASPERFFTVESIFENGQVRNLRSTPDLTQHPAFLNDVAYCPQRSNISLQTNDTNHNERLSKRSRDPIRRQQINKTLIDKYNKANGIETRTFQKKARMFEDLANTKFKTAKVKIPAKLLAGEELSLRFKRSSDSGDIKGIFVKFRDVAKRKFYWNIWEKGRHNYETYDQFKTNFDPNMNIFREIAKTIKTDVSKEIRDVLNTNPLRSDKHKALYGRDIKRIHNPTEFNQMNDLNAKLNKAKTLPKRR